MKNVTIISLQEWDELVRSTYGKIYSFQQQDDCKDRGTAYFSVPIEHPEDHEKDEVPEIVNGPEMGVSFKAWLARDPKQPLASDDGYAHCLGLWWERNFYPHLEIIAQDLYNRGLLPAGDYGIDIDW